MTYNRIIEMINEYLEEPHSIDKEWVEALQICRQAIIDNEKQQAEVERLQEENKRIVGASIVFNGGVKYVKSEAIKEFAERLKEHKQVENYKINGYPYQIEFVEINDIDNLVKEMTEKNDFKEREYER